MESIIKKYHQLQFLKKRLTFIKFFFVGGFCGLFDLALLYFFTDILHIWYFYSGIISFIIVSFVSFALNKKVTFKNSDRKNSEQYLKYTGIILVGMIINNFFLFALTNMLGMWYIFSRIFSSLIALIWNYSSSKKFIFLKK
jgi:putative flippase GtrA